MALSFAASARAAAVTAVAARIDLGSANAHGTLSLYAGTRPASAASAAGSSPLVAVPLATPAYGSPSGSGTADFAGGAVTAAATGSGTLSWFRVADRDGNAVFDGDVGLTGSSADLQFPSSLAVAAGQAVTVSSFPLS